MRSCDNWGCDPFYLSVLRLFLVSTPTRAAMTRPTVPARDGVAAIHGNQRWLRR
jgi:hypothetical protein